MKILCVLYDDPKDGMRLPTPKAIDFNPGDLLGCVSGELGLRKFLEDRGHTLVVTADKDEELAGMGSTLIVKVVLLVVQKKQRSIINRDG